MTSSRKTVRMRMRRSLKGRRLEGSVHAESKKTGHMCIRRSYKMHERQKDLRMTIFIKTESCVEGLSHMTHVLQSDLRKMSSIKTEHMCMR